VSTRARSTAKVRLSACLLLALAAAVAGCAAAPCRETPETVQLLLVNDVYQLTPLPDGRGGLARVATVVRRLRAENPRTLLAFGGDTISPSLLSTMFRGRQMIEAWNALGLDAATFGNHEFDFGSAVLRERMAESRFPWLSANVREVASGRPFGGAAPGRRWTLGRTRVAMVGLTLPQTHQTSAAGPDVAFDPPVEAARRALAELGPAEVRVAVTHLELGQDRALADAVPLHAILGGHDHDPMLHEQSGAVIIKAGSDAINVGQVDLDVACGAVTARRARLLPIDASVADDPGLAAVAERYARLADRELDAVVGTSAKELDARDTTVRRQPSAIGAYVAEVMRARMGADVGLVNGGGLRSNRVIPPGPLTRRDVRALLPFDNTVVLLEVSGAGLRAALERSVGALPGLFGGYLHTAGLEVQVDPARPAGSRVGAIAVGGQPLTADRLVRVALPDFLARGGDGYAMFARARVLRDRESGPGMVEAVLEALARGQLP
jgi:2',3'-cyclic-nucleotide 2'-phosphodiesterase (5'-nucleotidase family)